MNMKLSRTGLLIDLFFFWPGSVLATFHLSKTIPKYTDYGRSMKPFFYKSPKLLGRQFGKVNFGAFGAFLIELSPPILVRWVPCPCFPFLIIISTKNQAFTSKCKIFIWDWNLNLGRKEFGIYPSCVCSPCPNTYSTWVISMTYRKVSINKFTSWTQPIKIKSFQSLTQFLRF